MTETDTQASPVVRASARDYELAALVGDDAVIVGWTMEDSIDRTDLLGFGIKRLRRDAKSSADGDCCWLPNHRRFALRGTESEPGSITSETAPLQQFHFIDYAIDTGCTYTYSVVPVRGTPKLRYFEAPIAVTVNPRSPWVDGEAIRTPERQQELEALTRDVHARRHTFVPAAAAGQDFDCVSADGLADEVRRLTDRARSAVFLYSTVSLPAAVLEVARGVNSGRLMYGLVPGGEGMADARRRHTSVQLTRPAEGQRLYPVTVVGATNVLRYTSALVTDPWSRSPSILLWFDAPRASGERRIETRLITDDKRGAARLATGIFQAYTAGRLPQAGRQAQDDGKFRHLEPDGRWSNIYFCRHAASHKFREREIFAGQP